MSRLADQIRKEYKIVDTSISGDGESLTLEVSGANFTVIIGPESLTIYRCLKDVSGHGWQLFPGSKSGKSLKTVSLFINISLAIARVTALVQQDQGKEFLDALQRRRESEDEGA